MTKRRITLNIKGTPILEKNIQAFRDGYRYIINTGGSRSSKSTSILQCIIILCNDTPNTCVSIVTNSLKSMRMNGAVYDDFFKILKSHNIYNQKLHNKSDCKYTFPNGSNVEFFGVDDDQKVRGPSRDILFVNEANRIEFDEFNQLMMRTKRFAFLDRNPSEVGWIDNLVKEPKAINIHSTYKDNTFLAPAQVAEIENFINTDPNYYRIYALGLSPTDNLRIYNHFKKFTEINEEVLDVVYGLDFGMRDPTALVKCSKTQLGWYIEEICYEVGWTQTDLINFLKMNIYDNKTIYCDSSRPDMIEDLQRNGFNTVKSDKAIKAGIDSIRSQQIYIHNDSTNIWNEYYRYNWKENSVGETPIDLNNHSLDAIRYAIHSYKKVGMFNPDDYGIY